MDMQHLMNDPNLFATDDPNLVNHLPQQQQQEQQMVSSL